MPLSIKYLITHTSLALRSLSSAIGTASYWAEAIAKVRYARNYAPRS